MFIKLIAAVLLMSASVSAQTVKEDTLSFGVFGKVWTYRTSTTPAHVVLFISGDGGWNLGVVDMARSLATLNALVVGIDIRAYLHNLEAESTSCLYPAGDMELLSKFVQKTYGYDSYTAPVLVGYSSGATLVYATAVQAPSQTFTGVISMGFCPDLPLTRPMCSGDALHWTKSADGHSYVFEPCVALAIPWVVLHGLVDQVCDVAQTRQFVQKTGHAKIVELPRVGHGFSVQKNWLPQFRQSFTELVSGSSSKIAKTESAMTRDLPLIEIPAVDTGRGTLALILSGDGGWGNTEKGMSAMLSDSGVAVVGWNSLTYFWKARTPEQLASDMSQVLTVYSNRWRTERYVLIGYSFGADVLPFAVNRLPDSLREKVEMLVLLGPGHYAEFEFHLSGWLGLSKGSQKYSTIPELEKLANIRTICSYGSEETDQICTELPPANTVVLKREGGHRVKEAYSEIIGSIMSALRTR